MTTWQHHMTTPWPSSGWSRQEWVDYKFIISHIWHCILWFHAFPRHHLIIVNETSTRISPLPAFSPRHLISLDTLFTVFFLNVDFTWRLYHFRVHEPPKKPLQCSCHDSIFCTQRPLFLCCLGGPELIAITWHFYTVWTVHSTITNARDP